MFPKDLLDHLDPQVLLDTADGLVPMETPQLWWNTSNLMVSYVMLNGTTMNGSSRVHRDRLVLQVHQDTADCLGPTQTSLIWWNTSEHTELLLDLLGDQDRKGTWDQKVNEAFLDLKDSEEQKVTEENMQ